jgi:DTW domain-containing protein YfiP
MHHDESRLPIASGRMSHLCLSNSFLFIGCDFSEHDGVNAVLSDPRRHCVLLFPSRGAQNLSEMTAAERKRLCPPGKELVVLVPDGTWRTAKRIRRLSRNLGGLENIRFDPTRASAFHGVKTQPAPHCLSTIEAIHQTIDLLGDGGTDHHNLLEVFGWMIQQQLDFGRQSRL